MQRRHIQFKGRGFTLIELLVVIVIIGVLLGIATSSYVTAQRRSRDSARKAQVNVLANAVETYYSAVKSFPGKIALTRVPVQPPPEASLQNCEQTDSLGNFVYFYYPLTPGDTASNIATKEMCSARSATANDPTYSGASYKPFPSWIPNLGTYLGTIPIDKNYQGFDGTPTSSLFRPSDSAFFDVLGAADSVNPGNFSRTFVYRHLVGGYAIYTRIESGTGDSDTLDGTVNPITYTDVPTLPTPITGSHIYMVRK